MSHPLTRKCCCGTPCECSLWVDKIGCASAPGIVVATLEDIVMCATGNGDGSTGWVNDGSYDANGTYDLICRGQGTIGSTVTCTHSSCLNDGSDCPYPSGITQNGDPVYLFVELLVTSTSGGPGLVQIRAGLFDTTPGSPSVAQSYVFNNHAALTLSPPTSCGDNANQGCGTHTYDNIYAACNTRAYSCGTPAIGLNAQRMGHSGTVTLTW